MYINCPIVSEYISNPSFEEVLGLYWVLSTKSNSMYDFKTRYPFTLTVTWPTPKEDRPLFEAPTRRR